MNCGFVLVRLTDKEATFVLLQIYNAKIRGIFPLGTREVLHFRNSKELVEEQEVYLD